MHSHRGTTSELKKIKFSTKNVDHTDMMIDFGVVSTICQKYFREGLPPPPYTGLTILMRTKN